MAGLLGLALGITCQEFAENESGFRCRLFELMLYGHLSSLFFFFSFLFINFCIRFEWGLLLTMMLYVSAISLSTKLPNLI